MAEHLGSSATSSLSANTAEGKDDPSELKGSKKRKAEGYPNNFRVVQVFQSRKKGTYCLKAVKPTSSEVAVEDCPTVCLKEERATDEHAFNIMLNLNHRNILCLKLLAKDKRSEDPLSVVAFVEQYSGTLLSVCGPDKCVDDLGHVPSDGFRRYIRDIVISLDFLIKNGYYHGDLSWHTTLYDSGTDAVKLAGFKSKESMEKDEAKWNDWQCFLKMLEEVSVSITEWCRNFPELESKHIYCGVLDSLIDMMKKLDCTSLSVMKDIILESPFFWDLVKREILC